MKLSRRRFVRSSLAVGGSTSLVGKRMFTRPLAISTAQSGVLFEDYAIAAKKGVQEVTLTQLKDGRYWMLFGEKKRLVGKYSNDHGRTWGETLVVNAVDGSEIPLARDTAHLSVVRLRSGRLGMIHGGPLVRTGRDGTILFRSSQDEGKTWSHTVVVDPLCAVCISGNVRVLRTGRIVAPVMNWISPYAGGESEEESNSFCYSWIYYSDDEGKSWKRSLSEQFISLDQGRQGCYAFEEPVLEELKDGRLLMYGRTELGRQYQTISKDGGTSWSTPQPVQLAASYSNTKLMRIPSTGDLLLIWNQISTEEILSGLSRHRLSTAISKDEGVSWSHFRNLESLDDRAHIESPPGPPQVYRMKDYSYRQPTDIRRYPHAPGCLRICYPTVVFWQDEVAITYDYGYGGPGGLKDGSATKIKIVSLDWLYGRR